MDDLLTIEELDLTQFDNCDLKVEDAYEQEKDLSRGFNARNCSPSHAG